MFYFIILILLLFQFTFLKKILIKKKKIWLMSAISEPAAVKRQK